MNRLPALTKEQVIKYAQTSQNTIRDEEIRVVQDEVHELIWEQPIKVEIRE